MNEQVQRNPDGTFPKGVSGNPKGRAPKQREAALLAIGQEIINAQTWRAIVNKAALDALGKVVVNGQAVDDSDSNASGRNTARVWIRDTFIGKPSEYINLGGDDSAYEQLAAYSETELAAVLVSVREDIERLRNEGGNSPIGAESAIPLT
jgi:hypothetical protein